MQYLEPAEAVKAHAELDGSIFMGRLIHILPGKGPPPPPKAGEGEAAGEDGGRGGYKVRGVCVSFCVSWRGLPELSVAPQTQTQTAF